MLCNDRRENADDTARWENLLIVGRLVWIKSIEPWCGHPRACCKWAVIRQNSSATCKLLWHTKAKIHNSQSSSAKTQTIYDRSHSSTHCVQYTHKRFSARDLYLLSISRLRNCRDWIRRSPWRGIDALPSHLRINADRHRYS